MVISRRRLLQLLIPGAALGVAAKLGLAPAVRSLEEAAQAQGGQEKAKRQWALVVDLRRCDGCKYCTVACQTTHYLPKDQEWIKVYEVEDEAGAKYFLPRLCMHCENPPCLKVCPVAATFKDKEGVVLVDQDRCIGCRLCMAA